MTPFGLAWSNLAHKRTRTAIAAFGVSFAVVLIFMELGMLGGVTRTATMLYDALRFDLILTSSEYTDVGKTGTIPRARLAQARGAAGVIDVQPLQFGVGMWRKPDSRDWFGTTEPGGLGSIDILGIPPGRVAKVFAVDQGRVFPTPEAAREAGARIAQLEAFLYDKSSQPDYGRLEDLIEPDGNPAVRNALRLNGKRLAVVGEFTLGTGFSWNALLMCSEETLARYTFNSPDRVTFGLVNVYPGTDVQDVQRQLREMLPHDVTVRTRAEIEEHERDYWLRLTAVGQFLGVAVGLAIVVGVIFVYQMMAADIRNMLSEYATVKALGYRRSYLTGVVLWQAFLLAVSGYLPGFIASFGLYYLTRTVGGIPTEMTGERAVIVFLLTCGMCLISGLLAVRKVHAAEPADLF